MAERLRVSFGHFEFDEGARQIRCGSHLVAISPKAFDLVRVLLGRRPEAVAKRELIDALWPDVHVDEGNLKNIVHEVRTAFADAGGSPDWIRTVHRFGYAFAAEIEEGSGAVLVEGRQVHRLRAGANLIGRGGDAALVILAAGVSRHHSTIRVAGSEATLEDSGSKNGTWLNEERITKPVRLRDHDRIRIGLARFIFRITDRDETTDTIDAPERIE